MPLEPELLVTIKTFPAAGLASVAREKLQKAGITAYVSGTDFCTWPGEPRELRVLESQAEHARKLLGSTEDDQPVPELAASSFLGSGSMTCPLCGKGDPMPLPPYILMIAVAAALAVAILLRVDLSTGVITFFVVAFGTAVSIGRRFPKWKCRFCGRRWS